MTGVDHVLVGRLLKFYDPLDALGDRGLRAYLDFLHEVPPVFDHWDYDKRTTLYHAGRIRYFADILRSGASLDPVEIDNDTYGGSFGPPIIVDGHHRALAHVVVRRRRMAASYSGRVATLKYLTGARRNPPRDLIE